MRIAAIAKDLPGLRSLHFLQAHLSAGMIPKDKPPGPPITPDGRYFVVRGRLWRCSNPAIAADEHERLVHALMQARSAKGRAMRAGDHAAREAARQQVDAVKHALGERGEVWWTDGSPDYNRRMAKNTPYADWFNALGEE